MAELYPRFTASGNKERLTIDTCGESVEQKAAGHPWCSMTALWVYLRRYLLAVEEKMKERRRDRWFGRIGRQLVLALTLSYLVHPAQCCSYGLGWRLDKSKCWKMNRHSDAHAGCRARGQFQSAEDGPPTTTLQHHPTGSVFLSKISWLRQRPTTSISKSPTFDYATFFSWSVTANYGQLFCQVPE